MMLQDRSAAITFLMKTIGNKIVYSHLFKRSPVLAEMVSIAVYGDIRYTMSRHPDFGVEFDTLRTGTLLKIADLVSEYWPGCPPRCKV